MAVSVIHPIHTAITTTLIIIIFEFSTTIIIIIIILIKNTGLQRIIITILEVLPTARRIVLRQRGLRSPSRGVHRPPRGRGHVEYRAGRTPRVFARVVPARPAPAVVPRGVDLGGDGDAVVAVVPAHVGVHVEFAAAAWVGALER